MASANVDLVRSIVEPWERGDFTSADWTHPDIEYVIADGPSPRTCTGVAGIAEAWRDLLAAWDGWRPQHDEYRALDEARVLVLWQSSARGKASGIEASEVWTNGAAVFTIQDDKVTRLVHYFHRDLALADLGLGPDEGE